MEEHVKRCELCQAHQNVPAPAPLHPWEWPELPWCCLHAYYAGPFMGKMFLLIMDAHSKWYSLPVTLVTDNISVFTGNEEW